jgi:hypothetical protein
MNRVGWGEHGAPHFKRRARAGCRCTRFPGQNPCNSGVYQPGKKNPSQQLMRFTTPDVKKQYTVELWVGAGVSQFLLRHGLKQSQ